jgi:hypothetical protein
MKEEARREVRNKKEKLGTKPTNKLVWTCDLSAVRQAARVRLA